MPANFDESINLGGIALNFSMPDLCALVIGGGSEDLSIVLVGGAPEFLSQVLENEFHEMVTLAPFASQEHAW